MLVPYSNSQVQINKYIAMANSMPYLTDEEEIRLLKEVKQSNNQDSAKAIILSHLRIAVKIAMEYSRYKMSMMDLLSEGVLGLLKALEKFEITRDVRFSTYATFWVRSCIQDYILRNWSLVKIGTSAEYKKVFFNLSKVKQFLEVYNSNDFNKNIKQIAAEFELSEKRAYEISTRIVSRDKSLNVKIGEEEDKTEAVDLIESNEFEQKLIEDNRKEKIKDAVLNALVALNDREKYIIENRTISQNPETLQDLGAKFSVSMERVRQIEQNAIKKIKKQVLTQEPNIEENL